MSTLVVGLKPKVKSQTSMLKSFKTTLVGIVAFNLAFVNCDRCFGVPALAGLGALTGAEVDEEVKNAIKELTDLAANITGDGMLFANQTSAQLSGMVNQFNTLVQNDLDKPITQLQSTAQSLASQMYSLVERVNALASHQQGCLVVNSEYVEAELHYLLLESKRNIPIIGDNTPEPLYYQFADHLPGIVPKSGGQLTIKGFQLWATVAPELALVDASKKTIAVLSPTRETPDDVSTVIDQHLLDNQAGKTLYLRIVPNTASSFLGLHWNTHPACDPYYLPMVISRHFHTQIKVIAWTASQHPQSHTAYLQGYPNYIDGGPDSDGVEGGSQSQSYCFRFRNVGSIRDAVSHSKTWTLPLGARIIGYTDFLPNSFQYTGAAQQNDITLQITGPDTITASGSIAGHSSWNHWLIPQVEFQDDPTNIVATGESELTDISGSQVYIVAPITDAKPSDVNSFHVEIDLYIDGKKQSTFLTTANSTGQGNNLPVVFDLPDYQGCGIHAIYNPTEINGQSQVAVTLTFPTCDLN
jgi:hypothetical protein